MAAGGPHLHENHFPFDSFRVAGKKNDAGPRMGPAPMQSQSTQFSIYEGALRLSALPSQDAEPAAHELSLSDEEQAARGARPERGVQSVDEAPAAHEL